MSVAAQPAPQISVTPPRPIRRVLRRLRRWLVFLAILAALAGSAFGLYRLRLSQTAIDLPVAPARKGDFLAIVRCRGDLKAGRSVQISTPVVPQLRISWMAPPGDPVQAGESLIKFDSSSAT